MKTTTQQPNQLPPTDFDEGAKSSPRVYSGAKIIAQSGQYILWIAEHGIDAKTIVMQLIEVRSAAGVAINLSVMQRIAQQQRHGREANTVKSESGH